MFIKQLALTASIITPLWFLASGVTAEEKHEHEYEHEHRQYGSHLHGSAEMNLALEGDEIHIELDSPAANIVGFEHAPSSMAEYEVLDNAVTLLKDGGKLFQFNKAAGCNLEKAMVESAMLEEGHDHEAHDEHEKHDHKEHEAETHSDIKVVYHFECARPGKLSQLTVELFKVFPGMEKFNVQYVIENKQGASELTPSSHVIKF
jgi:hypothetical protein